MDTPLDNPDMEVFTDGSFFVWDGKHKAGYAVVTAEQVLEAKSLSQGISAQLAELVALTRALELSKGQWVNIYTESYTLSLHDALPICMHRLGESLFLEVEMFTMGSLPLMKRGVLHRPSS